MFLRKEKEFQYHPGIEKIIEDVTGGGTIDRKDLAGAIFDGKPLSELPPLVVVVKDAATGVYHVVKTAVMHEANGGAAKDYKVKKNHVFAVGDAVTVKGSFQGASDLIKSIDKSKPDYDTITLAATVGAANEGDVLVLAMDKQNAGSAKPKVEGEMVITMNKVDLTVANQSSGLLVRGTVNEKVMPFKIDASMKEKMSHIRFV